MEVKEKSKKRELIKTIAIIFLAVLLVLTFFSQTIMNRSLPEVATQMASSGTINAKVRGSGTLAANESYEVNINQTREVRSVCVKVGDKVETGDLLFVLGDVESQELKTAQEALDNARISYQKRVLELSKTYATEDQNVKTIREDLEAAYALRDANYVTDEEISLAKADVATAKNGLTGIKSVLSQIELALKELNALQTDSEEYANAKAKVTELEAKVSQLEGAIDGYDKEIEGYQQQLGESGGSSDTAAALDSAQRALSDARAKWQNDFNANSTVYTQLLDHVEAYYGSRLESIPSLDRSAGISTDAFMKQDSYVRTYLANTGSAGSDKKEETGGDEAEARDASQVNTAEESRVYNLLYADQQAIETAAEALTKAQQAASSANNTAWSQEKAIRDKIAAAQSNRSEAESELASVQRDLRTAQSELESASSANAQLKDQIRQQEAYQRQQEALQTQQEAQITNLESVLAELQEKQTAYKAALETVSAKERELETALSGKDIDKQLNNLDLQSMSLEIQKYEEQVAKYRKDSVDAEITSPVSGVITAISVSAGKETTPDAAMAVIDVVDRGYTIKIPVTNEQAKQVKVGDTAEVTNFYWGGDITATLEQIAPDPSSGGQKKLLVFRVTGDIEAGTNLTLSIGQRSAPFNTIVPKSALREDSNGKFVFTITSKSTPLGNRYTATRVDVQVLAEDDTSAAVSGLAENDYVITTSSKPLDAGSQVRMVENPS